MANTHSEKPAPRKIDPYASKSSPPITAQSLRDRLGALRNLWPFFLQVWATSPALTATAVVLRLARALLPIATLYVGKLIIDEALRLVGLPQHDATLQEWFASGDLNTVILLLLLELTLAIAADVFGRIVGLVDSLLSDRFNADASVRLMEHAATLDLEDFEDSEMQDQLDRARRQASGRIALLSQISGRRRTSSPSLSSLPALAFYAPWLIVLLAIALVPAFLGEAISMHTATRSTSCGRRSGANSNISRRPAPARKRPRRSRSSASTLS